MSVILQDLELLRDQISWICHVLMWYKMSQILSNIPTTADSYYVNVLNSVMFPMSYSLSNKC